MTEHPMQRYGIENNNINVFANRTEMGNAAAKDIEHAIVELLLAKEQLRIIFAAAPSQNEVLSYLSSSTKIAWDRIIAFNMDEYIGLPKHSDSLFSAYLNERLFSKVSPQKIHLINTHHSIEEEIKHYRKLITQEKIDIVCLGIGENGHIAFNDPPVANFNDKEIIKIVELDRSCRMQQVNEGCFSTLADVPETALTLTIPTIMDAGHLFCIVPGEGKMRAVFNTLTADINENCPATILRTHSSCRFYFDKESYQLVENLKKEKAKK